MTSTVKTHQNIYLIDPGTTRYQIPGSRWRVVTSDDICHVSTCKCGRGHQIWWHLPRHWTIYLVSQPLSNEKKANNRQFRGTSTYPSQSRTHKATSKRHNVLCTKNGTPGGLLYQKWYMGVLSITLSWGHEVCADRSVLTVLVDSRSPAPSPATATTATRRRRRRPSQVARLWRLINQGVAKK